MIDSEFQNALADDFEEAAAPAAEIKGVWALVYPEAVKWLEEEGAATERGDLAKLEKFLTKRVEARKGEKASESTIPRHAHKVVEWFKVQKGS